MNLTCDFAPSTVAIPPLPCVSGTFLRKFQGFVALTIILRPVLESGALLWLAVPNAMAESLGVAGPPDVGNVPVEAPAPGRFQHWTLAGAQLQATLQVVPGWHT